MTSGRFKGLLALLLTAHVAGCAFSRVNTRYNRFTNETIVTHRGLDLIPPNPWASISLKMQVEYTSTGLVPSRPETVTVAVVSSMPVAHGSDGPATPYKDNHKLELIADGDVLDSREAGYDPSVRNNGGVLVEYMWVKLPTSVFVGLAKATEVKGSIGPTAFTLTPDQVAELKDYAANLPKGSAKPLLEWPIKFP